MSLSEQPPQAYPEPATPIKAIRLGNDTVIPLDSDLALVASSSEVDVWHIVTAQRACTCKAFQFRGGVCKHLKLAAVALSTGVPTAEDRVAQRLDDPQERGFYDTLAAAADAPPADTELSRRFGGF